MDVMATALSSTRKYGMKLLDVTQFMEVNASVKSDPRMPVTRLRRYLGNMACGGTR